MVKFDKMVEGPRRTMDVREEIRNRIWWVRLRPPLPEEKMGCIQGIPVRSMAWIGKKTLLLTSGKKGE